jgi:hypothetical protein
LDIGFNFAIEGFGRPLRKNFRQREMAKKKAAKKGGKKK